ncbi:MAG TPA: Ig-like domain-containing protein, partial [Anaerolineales bacterium]|nr:Ig-like domain-containing protein [Anaerolineales bacterium]
MHTRRVYRRLSHKKDGSGWQVSWSEVPTEPSVTRADSHKEKPMKKRSIRWGCFLGILLVLFLVVGGGGLLLVRSNPPAFEQPLDSSIVVLITSPASGEEVSAGDYVSVSAQAVAPDSIAGIELFVDGKPFGSANPPDTAAWTWQAFTPGVHTFTARATNAKGETGNSQTVIVNVLADSGVIQVFAGENQTPNEIGSGYGASPEEI